MDDKQLRAALLQLGYNVPITDQTRGVLQRRVQAKTRNGGGQTGATSQCVTVTVGPESKVSEDGKEQASVSGQWQRRGDPEATGQTTVQIGLGNRRTALSAQSVASYASPPAYSTVALGADDGKTAADHARSGTPRTQHSTVSAPRATATTAIQEDVKTPQSGHDDLVRLQTELIQWQHRCQIAEEQLKQLQLDMLTQRQASASDVEHIDLLQGNMQRMLDRPSLVADTCFLAGHGTKLLANRAVCAMRCEALANILWRQDAFPIKISETMGRQASLTLHVCLDHSVRAVKELICSHTAINVESQRLVYDSVELVDTAVLSAYGINRQSVLHLVRADNEEQGTASSLCPLVCVVDMQDIHYESLRAFLAYVYTAKVYVSEENACGVFVLARRFEMSLLRKECIEFMRRHLTDANVWDLLRMGHAQRSEELLLICMRFVVANHALQLLEEKLPEISAELCKFWELRRQ